MYAVKALNVQFYIPVMVLRLILTSERLLDRYAVLNIS